MGSVGFNCGVINSNNTYSKDDSASLDDLSDMPTLVPVARLEHNDVDGEEYGEEEIDEDNEIIPTSTSTQLNNLRRSVEDNDEQKNLLLEELPTENTQNIKELNNKNSAEELLFAVTSSMNLSELADTLYKSIDPEQVISFKENYYFSGRLNRKYTFTIS